MKNRLGFTLVELAVVLVVIGMIIGMAIKGRSLIETAKIRAEMAKLNKFSAALAMYYSKHEALPPATISSGSTVLDTKYLIDGVLNPKDLDASYLSMDHEWTFNRIAFKDGNDNRVIYEHKQNGSMIGAQPVTKITRQGDQFSAKLACYVENMLDDSSVYGGEGRHIFQNNSIRFTTDPLTPFYADCNKASLVIKNYTYRIF